MPCRGGGTRQAFIAAPISDLRRGLARPITLFSRTGKGSGRGAFASRGAQHQVGGFSTPTRSNPTRGWHHGAQAGAPIQVQKPRLQIAHHPGRESGAKTVSAGTWLMSSCLALAFEGLDDVEQEKRRGAIHRAQEDRRCPFWFLRLSPHCEDRMVSPTRSRQRGNEGSGT